MTNAGMGKSVLLDVKGLKKYFPIRRGLLQKTVGTVAADGTFSYNTVAPGDHSIELKRDQFAPKRFQRLFQNGQTVEVKGVEVVLTAIVTNATVKLTHNPAEEAIAYRRNEETHTIRIDPRFPDPCGRDGDAPCR